MSLKAVLVFLLVLIPTLHGVDATAQTAYTGAHAWDGRSASLLENATLIVGNDGRIISLNQAPPPPGMMTVALDGRYIIPGLINAHGHVNEIWADDSISAADERMLDMLRLYALYGITTVNSLGDSHALVRLRDAASDRPLHARVLAAGPVVTAAQPAAARAEAEENVAHGVNWLKLRVDDNLGTSTPMPWDAVQAVVDVAAENDIRLATHMFYLEDSKRLLRMGSQMMAHSVRDLDIDREFLELLEATGVCYVPTLTRELSTFVYAERPDFFSDPFFQEHAHRGQLAMVSDGDFMARMAASPTAAGYRVALEQAVVNLGVVAEAGLPVAMGTDSGVAARFPGYFEHLEMWMMAASGMTPLQILLSATSVAADCLQLADRGSLESGRWADFLVLHDNPLLDIEASRSLDRVYIAGQALE